MLLEGKGPVYDSKSRFGLEKPPGRGGFYNLWTGLCTLLIFLLTYLDIGSIVDVEKKPRSDKLEYRLGWVSRC